MEALIFWSAIQGGLAYFLDFTFNDGNIFDWYLRWVNKTFKPRIAKPLGACVYCMNIWLSLFGFIVLCVIGVLPWYLFFPYSIASHIWLSVFATLD
jgi:hypothetical protein